MLSLIVWLLWSLAALAQPSSQDDLRQGLMALNNNDLVHAREFLEKASKADPRNAVIWVALAQTYLKSGREDLAVQAAGRARDCRKSSRRIELDGAFWESRLELGALLSRQGKWAEAQRELARSIELNPREARTHYALARVYLRLGKADLAQAERAEYERLKSAEIATGLP